MTKKDIIERVALKAGINKAAAEKAVNACLDQIRQELEQGNKVRLRGFGGFSVKKSAARRCRHPQTGELIDVAAQGRVRFLPGGNLKNSLDGGKVIPPNTGYNVGLLIPNTAHTSSTVCALLSYMVFNAATRSGVSFNFLPLAAIPSRRCS